MISKSRIFIIALILSAGIAYPGPDTETAEKSRNSKDKETVEKLPVIREVVVVTATLSPKPLKDCSSAVTVVSRGQIKSLFSENVLALLGSTPGIFVQRSGDFGRADPDIRGIGQNGRRVAVLVDGKPEKMGLFGCAVSHAFPLANAEKVEVIRGPASVLYGGEALGGVINIRTHMPDRGFETDLDISAGSYSTVKLNLQHGGVRNNFRYFLTYGRNSSDGHLKNSAYSGDTFTANFALKTGRHHEIALKTKLFRGDKEEPGPREFPLENYFTLYKRGTVDLVYTATPDTGTSLELRVYRNFGDHEFSDGWDSTDYTNGMLARWTTRKMNRHVFTLGADLRRFGGSSSGWPQGEWAKTEGSVFFHDDFVAGPRLIVNAGLRLQFDSLFGTEVTPQMGLVYQLSDLTGFRFVVSKGFRSPQLNELFMFPAANPELEPERVWNVEAGVETQLGRLFFEAAVFRMQGSNMVQLTSETGKPPFSFMNSGEFVFYGAETGLSMKVTPRLNMSVHYSYLHSGENTRGRPGSKLDFNLDFKQRNVALNFQGQYVANYFAGDNRTLGLPDYWLLNGRLAVNLSSAVQLRFEARNIFDQQYYVFGEFPGMASGSFLMPGRGFTLGLRIRP